MTRMTVACGSTNMNLSDNNDGLKFVYNMKNVIFAEILRKRLCC